MQLEDRGRCCVVVFGEVTFFFASFFAVITIPRLAAVDGSFSGKREGPANNLARLANHISGNKTRAELVGGQAWAIRNVGFCPYRVRHVRLHPPFCPTKNVNRTHFAESMSEM